MMDAIDRLGFGGLRFPVKKSGGVDEKELCAMIDYYLAGGGRYFDTAHGYMGEQSETALRECLAKRYPREKFLLADKLSQAYFQKEEDIRPLFQRQLECCGVSYFDYYFMHAQTGPVYAKFQRCRAYETVLELQREGKIRKIGISCHDTAEVLEGILSEHPWIDVVQIQLNYVDYEDPAVQSRRLLEVCRKYDMNVFVMEPVKGGSLVRLPERAQAVFDRVNEERSRTGRATVSNAGFAYRYAADFPQVKRVLSGVSSLAQVKENVELFRKFEPLDDSERKAVEEVCAVFRSQGMIPCTACRYCVDGCPKKIAIPDLFACMNAKNVFHDWNQDYYYHTVLTTGGRKASDCVKCGRCEAACPQHLKIRELLAQVAECFESRKKPGKEERKRMNLIPAAAELTHRLLMVYRYGGDLFEYLDETGIGDFDFVGEGEALLFGLGVFHGLKRVPSEVFYVGELTPETGNLARQRYGVSLRGMMEVKEAAQGRAMISFCMWNYGLVRHVKSLGYRWLPFGFLVDYSLYKNVVVRECVSYLEKRQVRALLTKFPQANRVKNQSELERWLGSNSVYGYRRDAKEHGLAEEELVHTPVLKSASAGGVMKFLDYQSESWNIVNGFRATTDMPREAVHSVWILGNSVARGVFADDRHTIASGMQRCLNDFYGEENKWNVVNASNYSGNDVEEILPFLKTLPLREGDVCVFHVEFPELLLERCPEIVDLSAYFDRPHDYGEIFVDINHMTGKGYCAQGRILFGLLRERGYFEERLVLNGGGSEDSGGEEPALSGEGKRSPALPGVSLPEKGRGLLLPEEERRLLLPEEEERELARYLERIAGCRLTTGAIVMNCNPFTLGHRYLIETAAESVDRLLVFVVEEDSSLFSFQDRIELVRQGTKDLSNVEVLPSGAYMISRRTFAAYSNKAQLQDEVVDPSMDVEIFARRIAPALGISVRFAGEEPLDHVTRQYNEAMRRILPLYGIAFRVIDRKTSGGEVISASRVRKLLEGKEFGEIRKLVPDATYQFLLQWQGPQGEKKAI